VVPRLADWSSVTLLDRAGHLRHSVARHRDPYRAADVERFARLHVDVATERSNSLRVARTGEPILAPRVDFARASQGWSGDELTGVLQRLGLSTLMVVPLTGRERTLGVLVLAGGPDRAPYTEEDFATAVEVGQRAGLAVDNALLYGDQRDAAEVLQRSLLTALPEPDHLEVVARYRAAGEQAQVGGDFFWAAVQPDGATVLAIGDVMGHDIGATAAMGQVQNLMRGIAYDSQDTPAGVLGRVDRAMAGLQVDTMATGVLGRIEQEEADRASGRRRLRWSNAGHPPPVVLRADGSIEVLDRPSDLLLGIEPESERTDHCLDLHDGDTLLLYTDGLVERRDSPLDHGLARLRQALTALSDRPLQQLCDEVLERLLPAQPEDDVALIAVRSHPEDRPRPAEAGPRRLPPERP
jgi:serine phosphatase RsbU (regulator of sigma subunit)